MLAPVIPPELLLACLRKVPPFERAAFRPFRCGDQRIGWVVNGFAEVLASEPAVFRVEPNAVHLADSLGDVETRSAAVNAFVWQRRHLPWFRRWNDEYAAVTSGLTEVAALNLARCASVPFGFRTFGAAVNGYVRVGTELRFWVAQRQHDELEFGGQLDNVACGFIAAGRSPGEVAKTELGEEAGLDAGLATAMRPVGVVRGCRQETEGVRPFSIYCFDLELDPDTRPVNRDGEIDGFELLSLSQLVDRLEAGYFKFNAVWVVVDWLVRMGAVSAERRSFVELCTALRQSDPD
jgi:8-oxo-dGTP pyrophosphatase MutT (NUDIX family)